MAPLRPAARMQHVEVLEEDLAAVRRHHAAVDHASGTGGDGPAGDPAPDPPAPPDVRRVLRRWWPVPVVVVLVVAAGVAVSVQRDRERTARLAAVPGIVRPLDGPPRELWTAPAAPGDQVLAAGGLVVLVTPGTDVWRASAHDPRTGAVRWSADVAPAPVAGTEAGPVRCPDPGVDVGPVLVCLAPEPGPVYADDDPDGTVASGQVRPFAERSATVPRTRVVALDARDGRALGSWTLEGEVVASGRVEDDTVLATVDAEDHVLVERRDAASGAVVWSHRSPEAVRGASAQTLTTIEVTRELVLVAGSATRVLDSSHGVELTSAPEFRFLRVRPLRVGFGTWSPVDGGEVHDAGGAVTASVPGLPAPLAVDDGSEPRLVVLDAGNDVLAHDGETGEEVWRATTTLDPRLLVDHRLVVAGASRYGVLDARTGAELWDEELGGPLPWAPLTDGALVLGPALAPDGSVQLVGRGLPDGVRYWTVPVPPDTRRVRAVAGHLVLTTPQEHRALG